MCGHEWFSRTTQVPLRCPSCKTRSWKSEDFKGRSRPADISINGTDKTILNMYMSGQGCVAISMKTGVALSTVIRVVRSSIGDDYTRM